MKSAKVPSLDPERVRLIESAGGRIAPLDPIGAEVHGIDLAAPEPPAEVVHAMQAEMAHRGFLVFRQQTHLQPEDFLRASCWWGGRELHSTHGVHPATPGGNPHIFRLSNDHQHGISGVGPQWHNDGSFEVATFSHAGYHMIRPAERGGGTFFAHQGAAFNALPASLRERWLRLASVNSTSGVVHPVVHRHPFTGAHCVWLHLGMTGAVIEWSPAADGLRLLEADELTELCRAYNDLMNAGLEAGYAIEWEYAAGDCVFIDNLAVAHKAAESAHRPAEQQGLRIMHRSTVRGLQPLVPEVDLPAVVDIFGPNPTGAGVWQPGGLGFRWDEDIRMQN